MQVREGIKLKHFSDDCTDDERRRLLIGMAGTGALLATKAGTALAAPVLPRKTADFRVVTSQLVTPEGPVAMADGSVLVCEMLEGRVTRVMPDGKLVPVARVVGAPNGAAIGPDQACYIANNGGFNSERVNGKLEMRPGLPPDYKGGSIQRINLKSGSVETLYTQAGTNMLHSPNDLVFDAAGGFYFSDLGKISAGKVEYGAIYWARADGSEIRQIVSGLPTPNGIALSPNGRTLYVALTQKRQIVAYGIVAPGKLELENGQPRERVLASLDGNLGFDSMKVEQNGNIVVGTLQIGCLTVFSPTGEMVDQVFFPDQSVTNLAFGGPMLQTVFVTLTTVGQLVAIQWPRPGLKLKFQEG